MIKELYPELKDFSKEDYFTEKYEGYSITCLAMTDGEILYRLTDITKQANKRIQKYKETNDGKIRSKSWLTSVGQYGGSWGNYEELCYLYAWVKAKRTKREFLRDEDEVYRELCELVEEHVNKFTHCSKPIREFPINEYRIDFYFPEACLIVEYDEVGHRDNFHKAEDKWRMTNINTILKEKHQVVRIKQGEEMKGYCKIMNILMEGC